MDRARTATSPERWARIKSLFTEALQRPEQDRDAFLKAASAADLALLEEVRSLLAAHGQAAELSARLASPLSRTGDQDAARDPASLIGQTLGHFRIEEVLGAGGMGIVYRAEDTQLQRAVALKVVGAEAPDRAQHEALVQEARHASSLNHPGICTIYEIGEDRGETYIAMELIEGEPLDRALVRGPLPLERALRHGSGLADALAHAHARGIVHRDLKSSNVVLARDGRAKVLDFGIARKLVPGDVEKVSRSNSPLAEGIVGTLAYIAPERLRGHPADGRSDLWSLGVVLYEMLSGMRPFAGATGYELTSAILKEQPRPLPVDVPRAVATAVSRCLRKLPQERLAQASDLKKALDAAARRLGAGARLARPGRAASAPTKRTGRSVAVLPFKDLARDPENAHVGLGFADATVTELARTKALLVRPTAAVMRHQDWSDPLAAARELGVDSVVAATFQRSSARLRVTVQLLDVHDGRLLWAKKITAPFDDMLETQDEVSREIAQALEIELGERIKSRVRSGRRPRSSAYEWYLKGRLHLLQETVREVNLAVDCFDRSRAADPHFAPAWAGLADAYARMAHTFDREGGWYEKAERTTKEALALDPNLPEARYLRGRLLWSSDAGFRHGEAMAEFAAALEERPGLNEAHHWIGIILFHVSMFEESLAHFDRALAINPADDIAFIHAGYCRYLNGQFDRTLEIADEAKRRSPVLWTFYQTALAEIQVGRIAEAMKTVDAAERLFPGDMLLHPLRGVVAALEGDQAGAARCIDLAVRDAKPFGHYHHLQYDVACIHALLGHADEAMRWLTKAAKNGFPCYRFFEGDPLLQSVRALPAFGELMRELRAECDSYRGSYGGLRAS